MRILISVGLLVAFATPAAAEATQLEFATPAQYGPQAIHSNLTWALLIFDPGSHAQVDFIAGEATGWNHTSLRTKSTLAGVSQSNAYPLATRPVTWSGSMDAEITVSKTWSSIWLEGQGLRVEVAGVDGRILSPDANRPLIPEVVGVPLGEFRARVPLTPILEAFGNDGDIEFKVHANRLDVIEWHNVTVACQSTCPDGAGSPPLGPAPLLLAPLHHLEWHTTDATLAGQGSAHFVAVGGPQASSTVTGAVRLPGMECQGCQDLGPGTLSFEGEPMLTNIRQGSQPTRLASGLEGEIAYARLDEVEVDSSLILASSSAAAAVVIGLVLWKLLATALFHRARDPLEHDKRKRIYEAVLSNPGITFRELQRHLGMGNGTVHHHLRILLRACLLAEQRDGNRKRLYENHGRFKVFWQPVAALGQPELRSLFDWLAAHPLSSQKEVVEWGKGRGWKRTATQMRIQRLLSVGLVTVERPGRRIQYKVVAELPDVVLVAKPLLRGSQLLATAQPL